MTFIRPPAVLSLRDNYEEVASFFAHLRHVIYRDRRAGDFGNAIDFESLKRVSPAAALMLAAELHRWQQFMGLKLNAVRRESWTPSVARLLVDMGLFDFLETPNVRANLQNASPDTDIIVMKYRSDSGVIGMKCDDLLQHLADVSGPVHAQNFIYDGLVEALKNSRQHAYSDPEQWFGVEPGTWFMSGSYTKSTKTLTAAVFDLGVGIPKSLPRAGIWEFVRPFLLGNDDGEMIAAAMRYGRSRTNRQERGNGLPTMMRILDHHRGYLRILSGTGEVVYDSLTKTITPINHRVPIGGTLIEWSISR